MLLFITTVIWFAAFFLCIAVFCSVYLVGFGFGIYRTFVRIKNRMSLNYPVHQ